MIFRGISKKLKIKVFRVLKVRFSGKISRVWSCRMLGMNIFFKNIQRLIFSIHLGDPMYIQEERFIM